MQETKGAHEMNETQETNETKETKDIEETKEIKETKETEGTQETKGTSETQETNETQEDRKQRELRKRSETPCTKNTIANWEYRSGSTESYTCMHLYIYIYIDNIENNADGNEKKKRHGKNAEILPDSSRIEPGLPAV